MSLFLSGTRDQAFVVAAIQEAKRASNKGGGYIGRTALQKIVYFLQVLGIPITYRFSIHHYGPYSDELDKEMEWLKVDEVVVDYRPAAAHYSNYAPGPAAGELLALHSDIEKYRPMIALVTDVFAPLEPRQLELLSTMHYAYRHVRAAGGTGWRERTLAKFRQFKGDKFTSTEMQDAYDRLAKIRLVEGEAKHA